MLVSVCADQAVPSARLSCGQWDPARPASIATCDHLGFLRYRDLESSHPLEATPLQPPAEMVACACFDDSPGGLRLREEMTQTEDTLAFHYMSFIPNHPSQFLFHILSSSKLFAAALPNEEQPDQMCRLVVDCHEAIESLSVGLMGETVAVGTVSGGLQVWFIHHSAPAIDDVLTRNKRSLMPVLSLENAHHGPVTAVQSLVGAVASAGRDQLVHVHDLSTGALLASLPVESSQVSTLHSFRWESPRGEDDDVQLLLAATVEGTLFAWDLAAMEALDIFGEASAEITSVCSNANGSIVAAADLDGTVFLYSFDGDSRRFTCLSHSSRASPCVSCAFAPSSARANQLMSWYYDGEVELLVLDVHEEEEEETGGIRQTDTQQHATSTTPTTSNTRQDHTQEREEEPRVDIPTPVPYAGSPLQPSAAPTPQKKHTKKKQSTQEEEKEEDTDTQPTKTTARKTKKNKQSKTPLAPFAHTQARLAAKNNKSFGGAARVAGILATQPPGPDSTSVFAAPTPNSSRWQLRRKEALEAATFNGDRAAWKAVRGSAHARVKAATAAANVPYDAQRYSELVAIDVGQVLKAKAPKQLSDEWCRKMKKKPQIERLTAEHNACREYQVPCAFPAAESMQYATHYQHFHLDEQALLDRHIGLWQTSYSS